MFQRLLMSFRTEQQHINPFLSEPIQQKLLFQLILHIDLPDPIKDRQTPHRHIQTFTNQTPLQPLKKELQTFLLINSKHVQHNGLQISHNLIEEPHNRLEGILDALDQEVG